MKKSNIVMIGMPGSGKSTLGLALAEQIGYTFVDVDRVIEAETGKLLKEIIAEQGDDGFLKVEEEINASLQAERTVFAPGGSVIYGPKAMEHLKEIATIVYLKVPFEELEKRLGNLQERGVVLKDGMTLRDLYNERLPYYDRYAEVIMDETGKDFEQTVKALKEIFD
jgi:shikimate kinase